MCGGYRIATFLKKHYVQQCKIELFLIIRLQFCQCLTEMRKGIYKTPL